MRKFLLFILLSLACHAAAGKDRYRFDNDTMVKAQKEHKLIFLFIGSDVCLESRDFLREIVKDIDYHQLATKDMIFAILDYDLNPSLSVRYSLPTIPGFLILDHLGNIYLGSTKPDKNEVFPMLKEIYNNYNNNPGFLKEQLSQFQHNYKHLKAPTNIDSVLDSTMNAPNHISLDLGRYILSLPKTDRHFQDYFEQFEQWLKSENYDFVEGSFFMPRGFSTYFAESKFSFFNFKLLEMVIDFYQKTGNPKLKYTLLKSLKVLRRDLFLNPSTSYSTGYASKKYFKMNLKQRLKYFPPAPRRFELAITQLIYLKIIYKLHRLLNNNKLFINEVSFLLPHINNKDKIFQQLSKNYGRKDGLLYFTKQKQFTSMETQLEYFSLLHLKEKLESHKKQSYLPQMEKLFNSLTLAFYDSKKEMFCDIPLSNWHNNRKLYQYPLYFVREHARLLRFIDYLIAKTNNPRYIDFKSRLIKSISEHSAKYPHRFYWLKWYNLVNKRKQGKR